LVKKTCLVLKIPIKTENKCVLNIVLELIFIVSKYENRRYMCILYFNYFNLCFEIILNSTSIMPIPFLVWIKTISGIPRSVVVKLK
jgi:hypothetical protein